MKEKFAKFGQKVAGWAEKIPEFSEKNFKLATYVCGGILAASSLFFIFEMFTVDDFGFKVNWNIFKSVMFGPLFVVGFILAIVNWGKFGHWGATPVYKDKDGNIYENNDVVDNVFAKILLPVLGHFVFEPIVYACIIYYPIVCIFALLNFALPYILTLVLIALTVFVFLSSKYITGRRYSSAALVLVTVILGTILVWSSANMQKGKSPCEVVIVEEVVEEQVFENTDQEGTLELTDTTVNQ